MRKKTQPTIVGREINNKRRRSRKSNKLKMILVLSLVVLLSFMLFRKLYLLNAAGEYEENLDKQYIELKEKVDENKKKSKEIKSEEYIKEKALDELKLISPDEKIIVIPKED